MAAAKVAASANVTTHGVRRSAAVASAAAAMASAAPRAGCIRRARQSGHHNSHSGKGFESKFGHDTPGQRSRASYNSDAAQG
jgi:hypothetical protein